MPVLLSYRNQSINLHSKSNDWFRMATLAFNGLNKPLKIHSLAEFFYLNFPANIARFLAYVRLFVDRNF